MTNRPKLFISYLAEILIMVALSFHQCKQPVSPIAIHPSGLEYAGPESCASCHVKVYEQHLNTAHYSSSRTFSSSFLEKLFEEANNEYRLSNSINFVMSLENNRYYQKGFHGDSLVGKHPFDITIGSGKRGQTYLYWDQNSLFQLPVSQYTLTNSWVNSPGYFTDRVSFDRPITPACMECHSTYMQSESDFFNKENKYIKDEVILGISCERCHGPAKAHVDFHIDNPKQKKPQHITKFANLNRAQKLHACALCHSGAKAHTKQPFEFITGGILDRLKYEGFNIEAFKGLDVHANQYGLLTASKCFMNSPKMDCSTCHNVHEEEAGNLEVFSARCMSCHTESGTMDCGRRKAMGSDLNENCIDCHMPNFNTANISIFGNGDKSPLPTKMRTHLIGIYPDELDEIKSYIQSNKLESK